MPIFDSSQNKHTSEAAARKKIERKGAMRPWENSGPPESHMTPEVTKTAELPIEAVLNASNNDLKIDLDSTALLNTCAKIGAGAAIRYLVLKRIADKSEGILFVSIADIASLFKISDQSVKRLFAALEEAGLLTLLKDYDQRKGSSRIYKFI